MLVYAPLSKHTDFQKNILTKRNVMLIMSNDMLDHLLRNECLDVTLQYSVLNQVEVNDYLGVILH